MPEDRVVAANSVGGDSRRVLVVDDEPMMRLLARESLESADFRVDEAGDGVEALEICRQRRPGVVLLDVNMPRMDGFETCRRLRESTWGHHLPILMMTGMDNLAAIREAYEAGATDFVNKPVNWLILGQRVEYMLRASSDAEALRVSQTRLAEAHRIARMAYWELYPDGTLNCPERLAGVLDRAADELPRTLEDLLRAVDPSHADEVASAIRETLERGESHSLEYRVLLPEGGELWIRQEAEAKRDDSGRIVCVAAAVQDVTHRRQAAEKIRRLSYFDELTGLPNRRSFLRHFQQAVAAAGRHERPMALLSIDFDRLQRVNDTLGHPAGDQILRETAERLLGGLRSSDVLSLATPPARPPGEMDMIARLDSDEFVVLLTEIGRLQDAATVAARLGELLAAPFECDLGKVFLTASIGIAVFPEDGREVEDLIQRASTAKQHAKMRAPGGYRYFDSSMNAAALERLQLESSLREVLERRELELWFQPQFDLSTGEMEGAEALLRWRHPERGLLSPRHFVPVAEETGSILPIGKWVLRRACEWAVQSRAGEKPVRVAVNLSARQFESGDLVQSVSEALLTTGLKPELLELELTEGTLMRDLDAAVATLAELGKLGVRLAIDDFGVGYSSLSYLSRFGVDRLKIDRSFISSLTASLENQAVIRTVISMARILGLEVVAEGIEHETQRDFLRREGCGLGQGHLLGRPMPGEDLAALIAGREDSALADDVCA